MFAPSRTRGAGVRRCMFVFAFLSVIVSSAGALSPDEVAMVVSDDSPTTCSVPLPAGEWDYTSVLPAYNQAFDWARALREDRFTTATLDAVTQSARDGEPPMAMGALLALRLHAAATPLAEERRNALRDIALREWPKSRKWGAELLFDTACNGGLTPNPTAVPEYLLDQLRDDNVRGNAFASMDLLSMGMDSRPDVFWPIALRRWEEIQGTGPEKAQERLYLANYLLHAATSSRDCYRRCYESWIDASNGRGERTGEGYFSRDAVQQRVLLDLAAEFATWSRLDPTDSHADYCMQVANRRMAWELFELSAPDCTVQLREILAEDDNADSEKRHAALVWMMTDPTGFSLPDNAPFFVAALLDQRWWHSPYVGMLSISEDETCADIWRDFDFVCLVAAENVRFASKEELREAAPFFVRAVREALPAETEPRRLSILWEFLIAMEDKESYSAILDTAVANMMDDDVRRNANMACSALYGLGAEGIPAAHAGVRAGLGIRDFQMISRCHGFLMETDPDYDPTAYPEVVAFMVEQLADDDVQGNAGEGVQFLADCGEKARTILDGLAAGGDPQQKEFAAGLLDRLNNPPDPESDPYHRWPAYAESGCGH